MLQVAFAYRQHMTGEGKFDDMGKDITPELTMGLAELGNVHATPRADDNWRMSDAALSMFATACVCADTYMSCAHLPTANQYYRFWCLWLVCKL